MKNFQKGIILKQIGTQLKKWKIENNKTSKEIASFLNITTQAYGNIERGESDICITRLILLSEYYKKPLVDLIPEDYQNFQNNYKEKGNTLNEKNVLKESI